MKVLIILAILVTVIAGCSAQETATQNISNETTSRITSTQDLTLTTQDLQALSMTTNGTNCTHGVYETGEYSSLAEESTCYYIITDSDTEVIVEFKKLTNYNDLNGSYQYNSLHLVSSEGSLGENEFGDQSRFHVNNEHDYGGEFNEPGMYYYHLWFTKDLYLIHITSKGEAENAKDYIENIGRKIEGKFG